MELFSTEIEKSLDGLGFFFVGLGGGEVDKGRSGNREFSFGNADL